ncbi:hypothetical protein ACROAH_15350 [Shewanella oncorhynchi]|uniref:hypothetical protein n=1 Tax=Shewanella TaxID=22 RepID=UPI0039B0E05D
MSQTNVNQHVATKRTQKSAAVRQAPPRKFILKEMNFKSSAIQQLFSNDARQQAIKYSIARIAGLFVLTSNSKEIRDRLEGWFAAEQEESVRRCALLNTIHKNELAALIGYNGDFSVVTPDAFSVTLQIEHPIYWRVIDVITQIDEAIAEIENLWLAGAISESVSNNSRGIAMNTMTRFFGRMRTVATDSSDRKGGIYSLEAYNKIMQTITRNNPDDQFANEELGAEDVEVDSDKLVVNA